MFQYKLSIIFNLHWGVFVKFKIQALVSVILNEPPPPHNLNVWILPLVTRQYQFYVQNLRVLTHLKLPKQLCTLCLSPLDCQTIFPNKWMGRHGFNEWLSQSPELTASYFFLWNRGTKRRVEQVQDFDGPLIVEPVKSCQTQPAGYSGGG